VDLEASKSWLPTTVALVAEPGGTVTQVALWSLKCVDLDVKGSDSDGAPEWDHSHRLIEFQTHHKDSRTHEADDIRRREPTLGVVRLYGRTSALEPVKPEEHDLLILNKKGADPVEKKFSRRVKYSLKTSSIPTITGTVESSPRTIVLRSGLSTYWGSVTNIAPVGPKEGLLHFHHYYMGVTLALDDAPMTIPPRFSNIYDCVPPVHF
jgi:hypothetical protein